jgi:hypothetical protein
MMKTKKQPCTCPAYGFPHRAGAGLCRWPNPPERRWQGEVGKRSNALRRRGMRKIICRAHGLHPIRDRERIRQELPRLYAKSLGDWCGG